MFFDATNQRQTKPYITLEQSGPKNISFNKTSALQQNEWKEIKDKTKSGTKSEPLTTNECWDIS